MAWQREPHDRGRSSEAAFEDLEDTCLGQLNSSLVMACVSFELGCDAKVLDTDVVALGVVTVAEALGPSHLVGHMGSMGEVVGSGLEGDRQSL